MAGAGVASGVGAAVVGAGVAGAGADGAGAGVTVAGWVLSVGAGVAIVVDGAAP